MSVRPDEMPSQPGWNGVAGRNSLRAVVWRPWFRG